MGVSIAPEQQADRFISWCFPFSLAPFHALLMRIDPARPLVGLR